MNHDEKRAFVDFYAACGLYERILELAAQLGEWYEGPGWRDILSAQARRIDAAYESWHGARLKREDDDGHL